MNKEKLAKIKEKIDDVDQEIISLLAKRSKLARDLAEVKDMGALRDLDREKEILNKVKYKASVHDLDTRLVNVIYNLLFNNSIIEIKKQK